LCTFGHDGQDGLVDRGCVSFSYRVSDTRITRLAGLIECSGGFEHLVRDLAGDLEHNVEK
jgi:hypothetical protein